MKRRAHSRKLNSANLILAMSLVGCAGAPDLEPGLTDEDAFQRAAVRATSGNEGLPELTFTYNAALHRRDAGDIQAPIVINGKRHFYIIGLDREDVQDGDQIVVAPHGTFVTAFTPDADDAEGPDEVLMQGGDIINHISDPADDTQPYCSGDGWHIVAVGEATVTTPNGSEDIMMGVAIKPTLQEAPITTLETVVGMSASGCPLLKSRCKKKECKVKLGIKVFGIGASSEVEGECRIYKFFGLGPKYCECDIWGRGEEPPAKLDGGTAINEEPLN